MKKHIECVIAIVVCTMISTQVRATIVAAWDFTSANASTYNYVSPTPTFSTSGGTATETISSGTLNYAFTSASGKVGSLNNTVLTFSMAPNHATISTLSVRYDAYSTAVTALSGTWAYSLNGGAFVNVGATPSSITIGTAAGADNNTFSLSGLNISPSDSSLVFRLTLSNAAGANSGSMVFDNMEFDATSAVPEPTMYALPLFGLVFIGGIFGCRLVRKAKLN